MLEIPLPLSRRWLATLLVSFTVVTATAWVLGPALHALLRSASVQALDLAAWHAAHALAVPAVLLAAGSSNDVHGTVGILVLGALAAWAWHARGRPEACVRLLVALPAGMLLNAVVKLLVDRVRPSWAVVDLPLSASFPSGHVAEATVFYGSLAVETIRRETERLRRRVVVVLAAGMVAIVAFSRIVVGVHFLSDCLGALVEAVLWLAACFSGSPLAGRVQAADVR